MKISNPIFLILILTANVVYPQIKKIPFKNTEGKDCNDLHIKFTTDDVGIHHSPCFSDAIAQEDRKEKYLQGGQVNNNETCTLSFKRPNNKPVTAKSYYWTIDGKQQGKEKRLQIQKLTWHGGIATGNGLIRVKLENTISHFHYLPGSTAEQTRSSFKSFIEMNFNLGGVERIHAYVDSLGTLIMQSNLAGDTTVKLETVVIMQDFSQTVIFTDILPGVLKVRLLLEGFYNTTEDKMSGDYAVVLLRSNLPPYDVLESTRCWIDTSGNIETFFWDVPDGQQFFMEIRHRNSISTWSANGFNQFLNREFYYNFTLSPSMAFGSNMMLKGVRWCFYSGDVDQNGFIDGIDMGMVDNDASIFAIGKIPTDLTGDNTTDATDLAIVDNNALLFISTVRP